MITTIVLDGRWGCIDSLFNGEFTPDDKYEPASMCCLGVAECDRGVNLFDYAGEPWPTWTEAEGSSLSKEVLIQVVGPIRNKVHDTNEQVGVATTQAAEDVSYGYSTLEDALASLNTIRSKVYQELVPLMQDLAVKSAIIRDPSDWDIQYKDMTVEEFRYYIESNYGELP